MLEAIPHMVVAAYKSQDDSHDVRRKEQLVGPNANREHAKGPYHNHGDGDDDSPNPKFLRTIRGISK